MNKKGRPIAGAMLCPSCFEPTSVIDSRTLSGKGVRRRRECDGCGYRASTHEIWDHDRADEQALTAKLKGSLDDIEETKRILRELLA